MKLETAVNNMMNMNNYVMTNGMIGRNSSQQQQQQQTSTSRNQQVMPWQGGSIFLQYKNSNHTCSTDNQQQQQQQNSKIGEYFMQQQLCPITVSGASCRNSDDLNHYNGWSRPRHHDPSFDAGIRRNNIMLQEVWKEREDENELSASCSIYDPNVNLQGRDFMLLSRLHTSQEQQHRIQHELALLANAEQHQLLYQFSNINNLVVQQQNPEKMQAMEYENRGDLSDHPHNQMGVFNSYNSFLSTNNRNTSGALRMNAIGVWMDEEFRTQTSQKRRYEASINCKDSTCAMQTQNSQSILYSSLDTCSQQHAPAVSYSTNIELRPSSTTPVIFSLQNELKNYRSSLDLVADHLCDADANDENDGPIIQCHSEARNNKRTNNYNTSSISATDSIESGGISSRCSRVTKRQKKMNDIPSMSHRKCSSPNTGHIDGDYIDPLLPMFPLEAFSQKKEEDSIDAAQVLLDLMSSN